MKPTKKLLAFLLAATMLLAILPSAFATEGTETGTTEQTYTLTIDNKSQDHTYQIYQIFTGDLSIKNNIKTLSNIAWGNGVKAEGQAEFGVAAEKAEALKNASDAASFAKELVTYLQNPTEVTYNNGYKATGLSAGYYLVMDKSGTLGDKDDFYTAYIMEVVGNVEATPKGDKPTLDKEIYHNDKKEWGVVGDNQIGDTVEFRTITKVPDTTGYTTYTYVIHDTMSEGLTSNVRSAADVTIKVNNTGDALPTDYYTVTATGNTFTVSIKILEAIAAGKMSKGDSLYTYYSGVLNASAKIYDEGKQDNTAYLEFSNNPNSDEKGETPKKTVYDWTFKMGVNKVAPGEKDGETKPLTGAKFVLSKNGNLNVEDMKCDDNGTPTVSTDLIAVVNDDGTYRIALTGEANTTYVMEAGSITIKGLDDATDYYLYETKAPEGYNALKEPVKFKITAEYSQDGATCTTTNVSVDDGEASGTLSTNVVNQAGSSLPSTGGMGTTIFYVLGSILAIGAAILLVSKKRMNSAR